MRTEGFQNGISLPSFTKNFILPIIPVHSIHDFFEF